MKLIYKGKFDGNADSLPKREPMPGAVKFKEAEDSKKLSLIANTAGIAVVVLLFIGLVLRTGTFRSINLWGSLCSMLVLFPHELLHAVCFKDEVFLYTNWNQGILFVVGTETMSKGRFIWMSLLPNLVFGVLPYVLFLIFPQLTFLGTMGALAIGMGAGDYYNVYNALTQMPKGARTYLNAFHSYWYMPD